MGVENWVIDIVLSKKWLDTFLVMSHFSFYFRDTRVGVTRENWILFTGTTIPVINLSGVERPRRRYVMQPRYVIPSLLLRPKLISSYVILPVFDISGLKLRLFPRTTFTKIQLSLNNINDIITWI